MKSTFKIVLGVVFAATFAVMSASAAERHWQGGTDDNWKTAANWQEGSVPGAADVAVFDPGAGQTVSVTITARDSGKNFTRVGGIRVESGDVSVGSQSKGDLGIDGSSCKTGTFYVATGSTLTLVSNVGGTSSPVLRKTGGGTVEFTGRVGSSAATSTSYPFAPLLIEEGVAAVGSTVSNHGIRGPVRICDGATLRIEKSGDLSAAYTGIVEIDAGGRLAITSTEGQSVSGIRGAGRITGNTGSNAKLTIRLASEDCVFSGTIEDEEIILPATATKTLTVAGARTLADAGTLSVAGSALAFASGVGEYWIGSVTGLGAEGGDFLPTEDVEGNPVTLHLTGTCSAMTVAGSGDLVGGKLGSGVTIQKCRVAADEISVAKSKTMTVCAGATVKAADVEFLEGSSFTVDGGLLAVGTSSKSPTLAAHSIVNGGVLGIFSQCYAKLAAEKTVFVDNGTLRIMRGSSASPAIGNSAAPWMMTVGAGGARFERETYAGSAAGDSTDFYLSADTAPSVETDGGITYQLPTKVTIYRPQNVKGPVAVLDGEFTLADAAQPAGDDGAATPFGTGSLTLGNTILTLGANADRTAKLACGAGATLNLAGSTLLQLRSSGSGTAQSAVIGPEGGTTCPVARQKGGALILVEPKSDAAFDGTYGTVKVNGGVPTAADGRVTLPIFTAQNTADEYSTLKRLDFTKLDGANGLVRFTDYVDLADCDGTDAAADKTALLDGRTRSTTLTLSGNTHVAALNVISRQTASTIPLSVPSGTTLSVGGAVDETACVLLSSFQKNGQSGITGSGTVDFGASEGVIAVNINDTYSYFPQIDAKIAGSNGVSYVGLLNSNNAQIEIGGNNSYTGGTVINGVRVRPSHAHAFGQDAVTVGVGQMCGGQVWFRGGSRTFENDFVISGNGCPYKFSASSSASEPSGGALWFGSDTVLTGDVEIRGRARISSRDHYASSSHITGTGTFKGVISGGMLEIAAGGSPMVFEGANTYTGGTYLAAAQLTLRGSCSVGTGAITLGSANSVLRFENAAPVVFTNDLEGVGTIEIAGTAPVTFTGRGSESFVFKTLAPGSTLNLATGETETVIVGGTDIDIDLKGQDVTVAGIAASGMIRGGIVTVTGEISPGGSNCVGTVAFGMPPVLTGARILIETEDGAVDKVVVPGDADISTLNLEIVQLGDIVEFKPSAIFACGGELTGEFAFVTKPTQKGKNYTVEYTASAVTLSYAKPGLMLLVR